MKLTHAQAVRAGIIDLSPPKNGSHEAIVATYGDQLLEALIQDLSTRNLRNLRDHEVRFLADRSKADRSKAARAERRTRQSLGTWTITKKTKQSAA